MSRTLHTAAILAALLSIGGLASSPLRADDLTQSKDKCVACHANPEYLVTNKKLYDYFQNWHTFDVAAIGKSTGELLVLAQSKYEAVRDARKKPTKH